MRAALAGHRPRIHLADNVDQLSDLQFLTLACAILLVPTCGRCATELLKYGRAQFVKVRVRFHELRQLFLRFNISSRS